MSLTRPVFDVHLDPVTPGDPIETHRVTVTHGDRLRAELDAQQRGIPATASYNVTSLMLWRALGRLGVLDDGHDVFTTRLIDWAAVDPEEPVDPTRPATPAGSPSPSDTTSPPSTGSTPTSTTD